MIPVSTIHNGQYSMGACRFELIGDTKVAITECAVDTRALAQKMAQIKDTKVANFELRKCKYFILGERRCVFRHQFDDGCGAHAGVEGQVAESSGRNAFRNL